MVASLRGELYTLQNLYDQNYLIPNKDHPNKENFVPEEDLEDGRIIMKLTEFSLSEEDMVDSGYDKSWI
jgi:hypothetical protein